MGASATSRMEKSTKEEDKNTKASEKTQSENKVVDSEVHSEPAKEEEKNEREETTKSEQPAPSIHATTCEEANNDSTNQEAGQPSEGSRSARSAKATDMRENGQDSFKEFNEIPAASNYFRMNSPREEEVEEEAKNIMEKEEMENKGSVGRTSSKKFLVVDREESGHSSSTVSSISQSSSGSAVEDLLGILNSAISVPLVEVPETPYPSRRPSPQMSLDQSSMNQSEYEGESPISSAFKLLLNIPEQSISESTNSSSAYSRVGDCVCEGELRDMKELELKVDHRGDGHLCCIRIFIPPECREHVKISSGTQEVKERGKFITFSEKSKEESTSEHVEYPEGQSVNNLISFYESFSKEK